MKQFAAGMRERRETGRLRSLCPVPAPSVRNSSGCWGRVNGQAKSHTGGEILEASVGQIELNANSALQDGARQKQFRSRTEAHLAGLLGVFTRGVGSRNRSKRECVV